MVRINNNKKGQAAIEFLMTYGWMLLVVLIVGALIFSFVDFGSLLPNKIDLSNNLKADPTGSVAYASTASSVVDRNLVKIVIRFNGASRAVINSTGAKITLESGTGSCNSIRLKNLETNDDKSDGSDVAILNGHTAIMTFNCSSVGLLNGDSLIGKIEIPVKNPKTGLNIPSTGSMRLQITG